MKKLGHFYCISKIYMDVETGEVVGVRDTYGRGAYDDVLIKSQTSSERKPVWTVNEIVWAKLNNMPRMPLNLVISNIKRFVCLGDL